MKYYRIIQAFQSTPWAILPAKLAEIRTFLEMKADGGSISEAELREQFDIERPTQDRPAASTVAVIPIFGVLARRMNMMMQASGGTSLQVVSKALGEAIASTTVKSIILDIDSPGGEVMGITELHAEILRARRTKPVVAFVSGMAASAAYHLASAAGEITATASALLGSVGVIGVHVDESKAMEDSGLGVTVKTAGKFKSDASGMVPLSEEGEAELQRKVDSAFSVMIRDIAKGRGLPIAQVRSTIGDARVVESKLALELSMIDRIETFADVVGRAVKGKSLSTVPVIPAKATRAESSDLAATAIDDTEDFVSVGEGQKFTLHGDELVEPSSSSGGNVATDTEAGNEDPPGSTEAAELGLSHGDDASANDSSRERLRLRVKADARRKLRRKPA